MYAAHQGGKSLRANFTAPEISYDRDGKPASFWGMKGSASLHDKTLVLTAVNPDVSKALEAQVTIHGAQAKSAAATVLNASDIHAHNTFEQRDAVSPKPAKADVVSGGVSFRFPAASVVKLEIELA